MLALLTILALALVAAVGVAYLANRRANGLHEELDAERAANEAIEVRLFNEAQHDLETRKTETAFDDHAIQPTVEVPPVVAPVVAVGEQRDSGRPMLAPQPASEVDRLLPLVEDGPLEVPLWPGVEGVRRFEAWHFN